MTKGNEIKVGLPGSISRRDLVVLGLSGFISAFLPKQAWAELDPIITAEPENSSDLNPKLWVLQRTIYYQKHPKEFFWSYLSMQSKEDAEFSKKWINRIDKARQVIEELPGWQGKLTRVTTILLDLDLENNPTIEAAYDHLLKSDPTLAYELANEEFLLRSANSDADLIAALNSITGLPHAPVDATIGQQVLATEDLDRVLKLMRMLDLTDDERKKIEDNPDNLFEVLNGKVENNSVSISNTANYFDAAAERLNSDQIRKGLATKTLRQEYSMRSKEKAAALSLFAQMLRVAGEDEAAELLSAFGQAWLATSRYMDTIDSSAGPEVVGASETLAMTNMYTAILVAIGVVISMFQEEPEDGLAQAIEAIINNQKNILQTLSFVYSGILVNRALIRNLNSKISNLQNGQWKLSGKIDEAVREVTEILIKLNDSAAEKKGRIAYREKQDAYNELISILSSPSRSDFREALEASDTAAKSEVRAKMKVLRTFATSTILEDPFSVDASLDVGSISERIGGAPGLSAVGLLPKVVRIMDALYDELEDHEVSYQSLFKALQIDPYHSLPTEFHPLGSNRPIIDWEALEVECRSSLKKMQRVEKFFPLEADPLENLIRPANPRHATETIFQFTELAMEFAQKFGITEFKPDIGEMYEHLRRLAVQISEVRSHLIQLADCYTDAEKSYRSQIEHLLSTYEMAEGNYVPRPIYGPENRGRLEEIYAGTFDLAGMDLVQRAELGVQLGLLKKSIARYTITDHPARWLRYEYPPLDALQPLALGYFIHVDGYDPTEYGQKLGLKAHPDIWLPTRLRMAWNGPGRTYDSGRVVEYLGPGVGGQVGWPNIVGKIPVHPANAVPVPSEVFQDLETWAYELEIEEGSFFGKIAASNRGDMNETIALELDKIRQDYSKGIEVALSGVTHAGGPEDVTGGRLSKARLRFQDTGAVLDYSLNLCVGAARDEIGVLRTRPFRHDFSREGPGVGFYAFSNWRYTKGGASFGDWLASDEIYGALKIGDDELPGSFVGGARMVFELLERLSDLYPDVVPSVEAIPAVDRIHRSTEYSVLRS